jgi:hypothetical protein
VAALVAGAHLLLVGTLWSARIADVHPQAPTLPDRILVLMLQEALPPAKEPAPTRQRAGPTHRRPERTTPVPDVHGPSEAAGSGHSIDWDREATRVARLSAEANNHAKQDCDEAGQPGSPVPKCPKTKQGFEWHPEPKTVEFSGLLPYVRVGNRCVVGLGFFGCAIGQIPAANGQLFNGMSDPNRAKSSVPDAPR